MTIRIIGSLVSWTRDCRPRWLLNELGDDSLIIGTDYGHKDSAAEVEALQRLAQDGDLPAASVRKILEKNPGKLYALNYISVNNSSAVWIFLLVWVRCIQNSLHKIRTTSTTSSTTANQPHFGVHAMAWA